MPAPSLSKIDAPGVASVGLANGKIQTLFCFRHGNQMNMVGHQTISPDLHLILCAPFRHQFQIGLVVLIIKKCLQTPVAPLGHVVRRCRRHYSCYSRHLGNKQNFIGVVNNSVGCPRNSPSGILRNSERVIAGRRSAEVRFRTCQSGSGCWIVAGLSVNADSLEALRRAWKAVFLLTASMLTAKYRRLELKRSCTQKWPSQRSAEFGTLFDSDPGL